MMQEIEIDEKKQWLTYKEIDNSGNSYGVMPIEKAIAGKKIIKKINDKLKEIEKMAIEVCDCGNSLKEKAIEKMKKPKMRYYFAGMVAHSSRKHGLKEKAKHLIDYNLLIEFLEWYHQENPTYMNEKIEETKKYINSDVQSYYTKLLNTPNIYFTKIDCDELIARENKEYEKEDWRSYIEND